MISASATVGHRELAPTDQRAVQFGAHGLDQAWDPPGAVTSLREVWKLTG